MALNFDEALKFQAELLKIKKMLMQIKELGIDVTKIELIILKLEQEVEKEVDTICKNYNAKESINTLFKEDFIASYYQSALKDLLILEQKLIEEYNAYSSIHNSLEFIESSIKNVNENKLKDMIALMIPTLKKLKYSSTINYKDEKSIVEKTYALTYQLIKLELVYFNKSTLLDNILTDEIDTCYTEKFLLEEIKSLDSNLELHKPIFNCIKQSKSKGLESTCLNLEVLNLLKYINNPDLLKEKNKKMATIYQLLDTKQDEIEELTNKQNKIQEKLQKCHLEHKSIKGKIIKYGSFFACWLSVMAGTTVGSAALSKKLSTYKQTMVTIETYDVNRDELNIETNYEYWVYEEDAVTITKYFPYQEDEDRYHFREIYTYDASDIKLNNVKDYATIDLGEFGMLPDIKTEYETNLEASDLYQIPRLIIEKITVDENNKIEHTSKLFLVLIFVALESWAILLSTILFYKKLFYRQYKDKEEDFILKLLLKQYKESKINIQKLIKDSKEIEILLNKILQEQEQLTIQLNEEYVNLPMNLTDKKDKKKILKKK